MAAESVRQTSLSNACCKRFSGVITIDYNPRLYGILFFHRQTILFLCCVDILVVKIATTLLIWTLEGSFNSVLKI